MKITDCAFEVMQHTGQGVFFHSSDCIKIYDYWLLFQKNQRPASAIRKRRAVMSALGKDNRFVNTTKDLGIGNGYFLLAGYNYKAKKFI